MNIIHTSDWHLGHQLHGIQRDAEHAAFLRWLADLLSERAADALIISGDIYDHANPSSAAQRQLYQFLAEITRRRGPHFQTVIIGGNHDSAIRLDAPIPLLDAMRVHVVGGLPKREGRPDLERCCVPLKGADGRVAAWCAAMPYLRLADLPPVREGEEGNDPLIEGVRALYDDLFTLIRNKAEEEQAVLATGHCYMAGGELSGLSERRILGGNQHALPVDIFPPWLAYVALGHLHKAQRVGKRENVRYCGAPFPLTFGERHYRNQVVAVTITGNEATEIEAIPVPRTVPMIHLGPKPLAELEGELGELPDLDADLPEYLRPYLEVEVELSRPEPGLRRRVEEALAGKAARLLKITLKHSGSGEALGDNSRAARLEELTPREVFNKCYRRSFEGEPPAEMREAFAVLLAQAEDVP